MNYVQPWHRATLAGLCAIGAWAVMQPLSAVAAPTPDQASAAVAGAAAPATSAKPGKPSIADFFRDPQMRRPILSPDGRCVAFVATNAESQRTVLAVLDLEQENKVAVVASFDDADIASFDWVTNDRLVFNSGPDQAGTWRSVNASGLWSVKRDGSDRRQLVNTRYGQESRIDSRITSRALTYEWRLWDVPDDDSGEVILASGLWDARDQLKSVKLVRLHAEKQMRRAVEAKVPENAMDWWFDPVGEPWAVRTAKDNHRVTYFKNAAGEWVPVLESDTIEADWIPFASDGRGVRFVIARTAAGTTALYRIDPATLKPEKAPLVSLKGYDFNGEAIFDRESRYLLGIEFETDAPSTHWFDPTLKQMQANVDQALPGRSNLITCRRCLQTGRVLVSSGSDTQPDEYFLYDHNKKKLFRIGGSRPWLRSEDMAHREQTRIQARDGLEFPVMVTMPKGKAEGPRPAVVLVHGGPYLRGTWWSWDALPQFLASRGYVVIEPEFRGSYGYGDKLFRAGWKQWGLAMQDDISDSLAWAVKQGWVDAKRVCIAGASYGGYATLMGMIKDPNQYRCGVSWAGVTDIDLMFSIDWSDASDVSKQYGMVALIGDPKKDAERFRQTSPLFRAAELKQPLLIAHGLDDRRVPPDHVWKFRSAVEGAGNQHVEYVTYDGEGHGWRKLATEQDFYGRMERFLARNIGGEVSDR